MKKTITFLLIIIAIFIGYKLLQKEETPEPESINISDWQTLTSEQYNFQLKYPAMDWNTTKAPDDELSPKYNLYIKPAGVPVDDPFTHFANITNISVFPHGIPTEGLIGETRAVRGGWGGNIATSSRVYTLKDGTPFAAYLQFKRTPESWNDSGFVWVRLKLDNMDTTCYKNGEEISDEKCNPLGSMEEYRIEWNGKIVNQDFWEKAKEVVKSISFPKAD